MRYLYNVLFFRKLKLQPVEINMFLLNGDWGFMGVQDPMIEGDVTGGVMWHRI